MNLELAEATNNTLNSAPANSGGCRLCDGELVYQFNQIMLGKHLIALYTCDNCGSLQTEFPYWLHEAYRLSLSALDTGAAQRVLRNLAVSFLVGKVLGCVNVLDFGGGDGLLCRFMRDHGFNCYLSDKYATNSYAVGFDAPTFDRPDLILAFEVLEHFAQPSVELDAIFAMRPRAFLCSTSLYAGQGPDWWYLVPASGQHIFFYSRAAIELVGDQYGYETRIAGDFILFTDRDHSSPLSRSLIWASFRARLFSLLPPLLALRKTPAVWDDHLMMKQKASLDAQSRKEEHGAPSG